MNSPAPARPDLRKVTDTHLIELIHADEPATLTLEQMKQCMKLLRKDHASTAPLIKRLMHTGTATGQQMVAQLVRDAFVQISKAYAASGQDEYWFYECERVWNMGLHLEVLRAWNFGNVLEETGMTAEQEALHNPVNNAIHGIKSSGVPFALNENSNAYWRGLTAFTLTKVVYRNSKELRQRAQAKARYDFYVQVHEFIEWAGQHPDINTVITTAKERRTLNPIALNEIITQGDTAPVLRQAAV